MRGKIRQLEEALDRSFLTEEHAAVLAMMLATTGYYTARIGELTAKIQALCQPYEHQIAQLDEVPGTGVLTAQDI
jgi:transposase